MTDQEWGIFAPFLASPSPLGGCPPKDHRKVLDGVFWISRTGAPWRDLPEVLGNWNSVHKQFRRWCLSGVWDVLLQALADSGGDADVLQMIDSTTVRAHRCAAGEKGDAEPGTWPLARRVHHQDPPPLQRGRPCHRRGAERGRGP